MTKFNEQLEKYNKELEKLAMKNPPPKIPKGFKFKTFWCGLFRNVEKYENLESEAK